MQLKSKNLVKNSVLLLLSSILIGLYIRSKDIKVCYFILDKTNQKKEISIEEYRKLEYVPSDKKTVHFLSKEPIHLNKKALIYGGSYFTILMLIIIIMEFKKSKQ